MPALPGYHPIDTVVPEARGAARVAESARRLDAVERPTMVHGRWQQTSLLTTADGRYVWHSEATNTDPSALKRVTYGSVANAGIQMARPGIYQIDCSVLCGSNLTAGLRYDVNFRINDTNMHIFVGDTDTSAGYFTAHYSATISLAADSVFNVINASGGAYRYGDATAPWTYLSITLLGS